MGIGATLGGNGLAHLQAAQTRHLHIQKHEIRFFSLNDLHRLPAISAFAQHSEVRLLLSNCRMRARAGASSSTISARIFASLAMAVSDSIKLTTNQKDRNIKPKSGCGRSWFRPALQ
jgi:hypothetical protein